MTTGSVYRYILNHLSVLEDEELAEIDFEAGLAAIDDEVDPGERQKLQELFSLIKKELPIYHHGIKGMKWGVRRYQNKDGSLTPAGKQRLADETAKQSLFGTASTYQIKTRTGETLTAKPVKPWSKGKKILNALMGVKEKEEMGRRGDANYELTNSKGESIGELSLISKNSKTAYIDWITIDKSQRGNGYATDIINDLIGKAKDSGYEKIELNALKKPRPLYERLGFTYTDTSKMSIMDRINGWEFGAKHMEYDLNNLKHSSFHRIWYVESKRGGHYGMEYELYHHGIKGMKWGVRRFQNKDGSRTAAGKRRYKESEAAPEKFKASNGMVVARPKNAYVKGLRKIASNRTVENFTKSAHRNQLGGRLADTTTNRLEIAKGENQIRKEAQAIREYNAHVKDLKRGTGTKYLDREVRKNKIDDAYEKVTSSSTKANRMFFSDATRKKAAKYMVDNNMSMKDATRKANRNAVASTAVILAAYGALSMVEIMATN